MGSDEKIGKNTISPILLPRLSISYEALPGNEGGNVVDRFRDETQRRYARL